MISIIKKNLPSEKVEEFQIAITNATNLTEKKRTYFSDYGFAEALKRAEAYDKAGADILFVEGPESIEEMKEITRSFDKPILVNMADGGRTPILSANELQDIGFAAAIFPATGFLAAGEALRQSYEYLYNNKSSKDLHVPMHDFKSFSDLMGFDLVAAFEKKWADV